MKRATIKDIDGFVLSTGFVPQFELFNRNWNKDEFKIINPKVVASRNLQRFNRANNPNAVLEIGRKTDLGALSSI